MGRKLRNAPLYYVVAQVQFNAVLELDTFLPAIQSRLREANYPDYKAEIVQSLVFKGPVDGQPLSPSFTSSSRHTFGDVEGKNTFLLEANALTFHTTAYETYEDFASRFFTGLKIVHKILSLALVERIGIRYLDAVYPLKDGEALENYLLPEVLGLYKKVDCELIHSFSETMGNTSEGQIISRAVVRKGKIGFPDELTNHPVIDPRFTQWDGLHAVIDSDAFDMKRVVFDIEKIAFKLDALHELISSSFHAAITPEALKAWE